ncbi:ATP synthase subunit epsilon, mitochondrial [Geospiza fortis]|uniref:ATP synthase subunit epsilon, mitochondrial n=18 Tax=Passeriformes TaxID=9126 RepID=A0A8N5EMW7_GEOFO|nr:ATP synthase subunit epsilon, mitochondrial [Geospiza fortis]
MAQRGLTALCPPGRSYIRYSQICAQAVRAAMKPQYKAEAERAAVATVKTVKPKKE